MIQLYLTQLSTTLIFVLDLIRHIRDPEHPLSLEELRVVEEKGIMVRHNHFLICIRNRIRSRKCKLLPLFHFKICLSSVSLSFIPLHL